MAWAGLGQLQWEQEFRVNACMWGKEHMHMECVNICNKTVA